MSRNLNKFNNDDRNLVVNNLEKVLNIKLTQFENYSSLFVDKSNIYYLIKGGKDWHGVKAECIDFLEKQEGRIANEGKIIIAKKYTDKFEIYRGELSLLFRIKKVRNITMDGQYKFNLEQRGNNLFVKEIPALSLEKLPTISLTNGKSNL